MSYTALYRKFRPATFDEVKGQDHIVTTLKNQIRSNRVGHAYLLCGTRGTGKTSIAKVFAKAVNCENPQDGNPCLQCESCKRIAAGANMNVVEIDAASNNGVDNIREIVEEVSYSPSEGKYRVYIIDEVHMLSTGAFNALLKTLEEPPAYVIFILATTEVNKIPITILSRCQRYDFRRISIDEISARLSDLMSREEIPVEERAIRYIAKAGDGSMRDALSLLDQCIAFNYGQTLTYDKVLNVLGAADYELYGRLLDCIYAQNLIGALKVLEEVVNLGRDLMQFEMDFVWYLRNLMLLISTPKSKDILEVSGEALDTLSGQAATMELDSIMRYIRMLSELQAQLRYSMNKRILLEMTLIRMCKPQMQWDTQAVTDRIRQLEDRVAQGVVVRAAEQSEGGGMLSPKAAQKPMPLKSALPEQVKQICERWSHLTKDIDQPLRNYLNECFPSVSDEGELLIVSTRELICSKMNNPDCLELLGQVLNETVGADVKFKIVYDNPVQEVMPNVLSLFENSNIPVNTENF